MSVATWTQVPLGDVATPVDRPEVPAAGKLYRQIGVRLWGEGAYERESMDGAATQYSYLNRVELNDIIVNKIWARHGAVSVVTPELADCWCSGEFPLFTADHSKLRPRWMFWLTKSASFWMGCEEVSRGTTSKSRLRPEQFLRVRIPLPLPDEQDRIVATLDAAAARVAEAKRLCREIDQEADALLRSAFHRIADGAPRVPMSQAAPVHRRPVEVNVLEEYPQVALKSFGKGTFHRPPFRGSEITWQKPFRVRAGDLLFCNTNAWEGAVGVALPEDDNHCGSHRYVTFVPNLSIATPEFVLFYLLTSEGMRHLQHASPGTTVRNRTMNIAMVMDIPVPLPPIEQQHWFNALQAKLRDARSETSQIVTEAEAMIPAILDRVFKGELDTAAMIANAASVSIGATPVIAGGGSAQPDPDQILAGPGSALSSTRAGKPVASAHSARLVSVDTVQTWNIPEIAAIQSELVRRNGGSATLGRKKISKGAYLAAALLGAKQNPPPLRKAAGPFNTQGQNEVEAYATQAGWFRDSGLASGQRSSSRYRSGDRITEAAAKAKGLIAARAADFERFVNIFVSWDSDTAELHATAHAAWNGLIAAGKPVTEAAIIETFFEWSEEKAKFKASQIRSALATLRSLGMEPNGGGPVVSGVGESNLFSGASR
jgi:type I restriction enzyme S subunit